jgi:hypothetical protein
MRLKFRSREIDLCTQGREAREKDERSFVRETRDESFFQRDHSVVLPNQLSARGAWSTFFLLCT